MLSHRLLTINYELTAVIDNYLFIYLFIHSFIHACRSVLAEEEKSRTNTIAREGII